MSYNAGHWTHESSGSLRSPVEKFLKGEELRIAEIELLRDYLIRYTSVMRLPRKTRLRIENIRAESHLRDSTEELLELGVDPW